MMKFQFQFTQSLKVSKGACMLLNFNCAIIQPFQNLCKIGMTGQVDVKKYTCPGKWF